MKVKFVLVMISVAVFACTFLSCRQKQTAVNWQERPTEELEAIGFLETGDRVVTEPFTMSMVVRKSVMNASYESMEIWEDIQRVTGVTLEFIEIPDTSFVQQRNLMLASGDVPDVFLTGVDVAEQVRYGPAGLLIPLEELIKKYAPRIQALFDDRPDIRRALTAPDGHIYALPGFDEMSFRTNMDNAFINKTWLDKLGLEIPTTLDEFYNVLIAFRDQDPNGNGRQDEIPFSFFLGGPQFNIFSFYAAFGQFDYADRVIVKDGKAVFTANTPEWQEATGFFAKLYAEGLIDTEAFIQDRGTYFSKGQNPETLFGVFMAWFDENVVGTQRALQDYVMLPPLIGVDGERRWNKTPDQLLERTFFGITNKMLYPEVAIRFVDLFFDPDWAFQLKYGPFGVTLDREGDRIVQLLPPDGITMDEFRYKNAPSINIPFALTAADYENFAMADNAVRKHERYLVYRNYFIPDEMIYPAVHFLPREMDELARLYLDVRDYVNSMRSKFIMGIEDINTGWDAYLRQLDRAGLKRYMEIHQAALDRYYRE